MKLSVWMKREKITTPKLAKMVGVSDTATRKWVKEKGSPKLVYGRKIIALSEGAVGWDDLYPIRNHKKAS